ncbi:MAG: hypothetical protein U0822_18610 [Anaerolineae bacterium]
MKLRRLIAVVAILAVVLFVAGVTAADGPQRINLTSLPMPTGGTYNGAGPDGNISALQISQTSATRGPNSPAIYGTGIANDGGWLVSNNGNGAYAQGWTTGIWAVGFGYGGIFQNLGAGPGIMTQSAVGQGLLARQDSAVHRNTPAVQGFANAEDGGWFSSVSSNGVFAQGGNAGGVFSGGGQGVFVQSINNGAPGAIVNGAGDGIRVSASSGNGINATGSQHGIFTSGGQDGLMARGGADGIDTRTNSGSGNRSALFARNEGSGPGIVVDGPNSGSDNDGIRVTINGNGSTSAIVARANGDNANGIVGIARNGDTPYAIWGQGDGEWAGYFSGDVRVTGTLDNGLAAVKMDDPSNPTGRYINQAAVVGGDMLTLYNGNATTDAKGLAVVKVPAYVETISKDFRYQLTPIGQFAQAIIAKELNGGEFVIQTDKPNVKVSWQLSGVRSDPYAQASSFKAVEDKNARDLGTYLHPEAYGQSKSLGVDAKRIAALDAKLDASQAEAAARDAAAKDAAAKNAVPFVMPDLNNQPPLPPMTARPDVSLPLAMPTSQSGGKTR